MVLPFEGPFAPAALVLDGSEAPAGDYVYHLIQREFHGRQGGSRRNLGHPGFTDALLSVKLQKRRLALAFFPPFQFHSAQVCDEVAPVDWHTDGFHPLDIGVIRDYPVLGCA